MGTIHLSLLPNKKYRNPTEKEKEGFKKLIDILKNSSANDEAEEIQTKIYEIGNMYRAEKSDTNKHLSEIFALDIEGNFTKIKEIIDQVKNLFIGISKYLSNSQIVKQNTMFTAIG